MGIVEFLPFAILAAAEVFGGKSRDKTNSTEGWWRRRFRDAHAWHFWFFGLAIHAGLAVLLVSNRITNTNTEIDYAPELHSLSCEYMGWMYADKSGARTGMFVSIGLGFALVIVILLFKWIKECKSGFRYIGLVVL